MTTRTTNLPAMTDEQRFRELGDRFVRTTDPEEQNRLKTELVRFILQEQASRQQQVIRDFADLCCAAGLA
jgi:hypothetical protein